MSTMPDYTDRTSRTKKWLHAGTITQSPTPGGQQQGPHQGKIGKTLDFFGCFRSMEKIASDGPKQGRDNFVPTNPDLADILGRTDLICQIFYFVDFLDPKLLNFQVPKSQNFWISRSPDLQIPKIPDFQVPRFPDGGDPPLVAKQFPLCIIGHCVCTSPPKWISKLVGLIL